MTEPSSGGFTAAALDASGPSPVVPWSMFDANGWLPPNLYVDFVCMAHFSTDPDPGSWPRGAVWPPYPADPVQDYWQLAPFATTDIQLPEQAWTLIRTLPGVYAHGLAGPRTAIPLGITYDQLVHLPGWRRNPVSLIPVLHHAPVADAGAPRVWNIRAAAHQELENDLQLDGSRSRDPDGGSVTCTWSLRAAPSDGFALPWRAPLTGINPVALAAGTSIPDTALGSYIFRITTSSAYGVSTSDVTHTIAKVNSAPVADAGPDVRVRVVTGARLKEDVVVDAGNSTEPDGEPLTFTWRTVPPPGYPPLVGDLLLPAPVTLDHPSLRVARAGTKLTQDTNVFFGLEVSVSDPLGATASDTTVVWLDVVRPEISLGEGDPSVIGLEELNESGLTLPIRITRPDDPDCIEPDAWELEVLDRTAEPPVSVDRRPVDSSAAQGGALVWWGENGPGAIARPGRFALVLHGLTDGILFCSSNSVEVDVVHLDVSFRGSALENAVTWGQLPGHLPPTFPPAPGTSPFPSLPTAGGTKKQHSSRTPLGTKNPAPGLGGGTGPQLDAERAFPIDWPGPSMPELTVHALVIGPSPEDLEGLQVHTRLRFTWSIGGVEQEAHVPTTEWHVLEAGQSRWDVPLDAFAGGDVTAEVRVTHRGVTITRGVDSTSPVLGRNPDPVEARHAIGGLAYQAYAYDVSRFRQFGTDTQVSIGDLVLSRPHDAAGRAGLAGIAEATTEQAWNWRANVDEFRALAASAQRDALDLEAAAVLTGTPGAPLATDEMNLETWTRLGDPSASYHAFDQQSQQWRPVVDEDGDGAGEYRRHAERLGFLLAAVQSGRPPRDWATAPGASLGPAPGDGASAADAIRVLFASSAPNDASLAAAYGVLGPLGWWDLHSALDKLAGPGAGPSAAGILDVLAAGALAQHRDPRIVAAVEAARFRRGLPTLTDGDLAHLRLFVESLLELDPTDQYLALRSIGCPDLTAETIVATAGSGDGAPAGETTSLTGRTARATASGTVPFGAWDRPGNMPEPFYLGTAIHRSIAARYRSIHGVEAQFIATNDTPVGAIVNALAAQYQFDTGAMTDTLARPDILEFSVNHFPPVLTYEIKPAGAELLAETTALRYCDQLIRANVPVGLGPQNLPGTAGIVSAPDGWAQYISPRAGVIVYQYFKAPLADVRARNEAEGREERRSTVWQRVLVAAGWGALAALLAALVLAALAALGFVVAIAALVIA